MSNGDGRLSSDTRWVIGTIVATGIGVAAIIVVTAWQFNRAAEDMRHHEDRVNASNGEIVMEIRMLVSAMRNDYRERMHGVEDLLREVRTIGQSLEAPEESRMSGTSPTLDLQRVLSDIELVLGSLIHYRPAGARYVGQRLEEVRDELRVIRQRLEDPEEPPQG